jgi:hypothetical protein
VRTLDDRRSDDLRHQAMAHMGSLDSVALRATRASDDANDLDQETCLTGYQGFGGFEQGTSLRTWLHASSPTRSSTPTTRSSGDPTSSTSASSCIAVTTAAHRHRGGNARKVSRRRADGSCADDEVKQVIETLPPTVPARRTARQRDATAVVASGPRRLGVVVAVVDASSLRTDLRVGNSKAGSTGVALVHRTSRSVRTGCVLCRPA